MATHIVNSAQKVAPADQTFCDFPPTVADALEQEAVTTTYPTGAVLFAEGQAARGVFIVRRGRVKLFAHGGRERLNDAAHQMSIEDVDEDCELPVDCPR